MRWPAALAAACAAALSGAPSGAATVRFDDPGAFAAAVAGLGLVRDGFEAPVAGAAQIVLESGVTARNLGGRRCCDDNSVAGGVYNNAVDGDAREASGAVLWSFPAPVIAAGFDYYVPREGALRVAAAGEAWTLHPEGGGAAGFLGLLAEAPFGTLRFSGTGTTSILFDIDDLRFAPAPAPVPVPLPGGLAALAPALLAAAVAGRRRP